jgi:hypothetical protein
VQTEPGDQREGDHREHRDERGGRADIVYVPDMAGRVMDSGGGFAKIEMSGTAGLSTSCQL